MTVEEAIAEKRKAEEAIQVILQQFMDYTGTTVHGVKLEFIQFRPVDKKEEQLRLTVVSMDVRI